MRAFAVPTIHCWASKPAEDEIVEENAVACCVAGEVDAIGKGVESKSEEDPAGKRDIVAAVAVAGEPER